VAVIHCQNQLLEKRPADGKPHVRAQPCTVEAGIRVLHEPLASLLAAKQTAGC
jgi:hypothetical protein